MTRTSQRVSFPSPTPLSTREESRRRLPTRRWFELDCSVPVTSSSRSSTPRRPSGCRGTKRPLGPRSIAACVPPWQRAKQHACLGNASPMPTWLACYTILERLGSTERWPRCPNYHPTRSQRSWWNGIIAERARISPMCGTCQKRLSTRADTITRSTIKAWRYASYGLLMLSCSIWRPRRTKGPRTGSYRLVSRRRRHASSSKRSNGPMLCRQQRRKNQSHTLRHDHDAWMRHCLTPQPERVKNSP